MKATTAAPQTQWIAVRVPSVALPARRAPERTAEVAWLASGVSLAVGLLHAVAVLALVGTSIGEPELRMSIDLPIALLFIVGGLVALATAHSWPAKLPPSIRTGVVLLVATLMIARGVAGLGIDLVVALASMFADAGFHPLILHNPWFIFGGLLFGALAAELRESGRV